MRPSAGVECRSCREEKDHRCQAQIYVDGIPLCLPCADGDPCTVDRVGAPCSAEPELFEPETLPAPVVHRTAEELGIPAVVPMTPENERRSDEDFQRQKREASAMIAAVERRKRGEPKRQKKAVREVRSQKIEARTEDMPRVIPEEVRRAVPADAKEMTLKEVAAKHGLGVSTVHRIVAQSRGGEKPPRRTTALLRRGQRSIVIGAPAPREVNGAATVRVQIAVDLTPQEAIERFAQLSPAQMALALQAALQTSLREG